MTPTPGTSGTLGGGTIPQTLDQLLERQWEQGSQFLMEQAQHFDSEYNDKKLVYNCMNLVKNKIRAFILYKELFSTKKPAWSVFHYIFILF